MDKQDGSIKSATELRYNLRMPVDRRFLLFISLHPRHVPQINIGFLSVLMTHLNESLLDDLFGKLEAARAWSPRVISNLETLIHVEEIYASQDVYNFPGVQEAIAMSSPSKW